MGTRVKDWLEFADFVADHVSDTESGHYAGAEAGQAAAIDTMEYIDGFFGLLSLVAWIKDVIKYTSRFYRTRNPVDLYKAANYLCHMHKLTTMARQVPRDDDPDTGHAFSQDTKVNI